MWYLKKKNQFNIYCISFPVSFFFSLIKTSVYSHLSLALCSFLTPCTHLKKFWFTFYPKVVFSLLGHFAGLFLPRWLVKANEHGMHMYKDTFYIYSHTHRRTPSHCHSVGTCQADSVWGLPYIKPSVSFGIHYSKCFCSWCITIRSTPKSPNTNHPYCLSKTSAVPVHSTLWSLKFMHTVSSCYRVLCLITLSPLVMQQALLQEINSRLSHIFWQLALGLQFASLSLFFLFLSLWPKIEFSNKKKTLM